LKGLVFWTVLKTIVLVGAVSVAVVVAKSYTSSGLVHGEPFALPGYTKVLECSRKSIVLTPRLVRTHRAGIVDLLR